YYDIYYIEKNNFINRTNNFTNNFIVFKKEEKIKYGYYFYIFIDVLSDIKTDIAKQEKSTPEKEKTTKVETAKTDLNADGFNIYEGLELVKYLRKHKKFVVCIQKLENKNLYKFHFVKKCENGIQLKKKTYKNLFSSTKPDNLSYMNNWIYKEDTLKDVLYHIKNNKDLLNQLTNNFAYYRNFNSVKDKSYVIDVFDPREADSTNIIVCRKKTYGKNIKSLQLAGYPKDISNLNRTKFKSSDFYGEHSVKDDYYTNGICEDGYSNVTTKKNNQVVSVGYSPYIKFDEKSLIAFKKEKITPEKEKTDEEKTIIAETNKELDEENKITNKRIITIKNKDVSEWEKKILKAELFEKQNPSKCKETKTLVSKSYCIKKSDFLKLGEYKEIKDFPAGFVDSLVGCKSISCINQNAGKKVYKIFVQRGEQYHTRYPGAIIQGMVWFELLYFKRLKSSRFLDEFTYYNFEQPISGRKGKALLSLINMNNGRIKMRQALGYSLYDKTEDVIAAQWLLGEFMNKDKLKTVKNKSFTSDFEKRKELLDKYKDALARFNKKLKEKKNEAQN
ncbi:hypothetical protein N9352_00685, partial [Candidatus Pelagibacter sp.]|nr:hypothetical protein [Candidatus Pelagibacter sp.]